MKIEIEIYDRDLEDRAIILEMRSLVEEKMGNLSNIARNQLINDLRRLDETLEWIENGWYRWQRERVLLKMSEVMNVDRKRFGCQECWD